MEPPKLKLMTRLTKITQLCIVLTVMFSVLLIAYAFHSSNSEFSFLKDKFFCINNATVETNQANALAIQTILDGLANLDNPEKLQQLKNQVPDIVTRMNNALYTQQQALAHCVEGHNG